MKRILLALFGITAVAMIAQFAVSDPAPFNFETNRRFKQVEVKKVMRFQLNSASVFPSGDTLTMTDQFGNPAVLPAGADILHTYFYVKTVLAPSGSFLKVTCGGATLLSATDETGVAANALFDGNPAYNFAYSSSGTGAYVGSAQCTITATQSSGIFSGGKVYGYTEYVNVLP